MGKGDHPISAAINRKINGIHKFSPFRAMVANRGIRTSGCPGLLFALCSSYVHSRVSCPQSGSPSCAIFTGHLGLLREYFYISLFLLLLVPLASTLIFSIFTSLGEAFATGISPISDPTTVVSSSVMLRMIQGIFKYPASSLARDDFTAPILTGAHQGGLVHTEGADGLHQPRIFASSRTPKG